MFYVYNYFSKIGTFFLLPGHPGQGLKIGIVPAKSGHLAGLDSSHPGLDCLLLEQAHSVGQQIGVFI